MPRENEHKATVSHMLLMSTLVLVTSAFLIMVGIGLLPRKITETVSIELVLKARAGEVPVVCHRSGEIWHVVETGSHVEQGDILAVVLCPGQDPAFLGKLTPGLLNSLDLLNETSIRSQLGDLVDGTIVEALGSMSHESMINPIDTLSIRGCAELLRVWVWKNCVISPVSGTYVWNKGASDGEKLQFGWTIGKVSNTASGLRYRVTMRSGNNNVEVGSEGWLDLSKGTVVSNRERLGFRVIERYAPFSPDELMGQWIIEVEDPKPTHRLLLKESLRGSIVLEGKILISEKPLAESIWYLRRSSNGNKKTQ